MGLGLSSSDEPHPPFSLAAYIMEKVAAEEEKNPASQPTNQQTYKYSKQTDRQTNRSWF